MSYIESNDQFLAEILMEEYDDTTIVFGENMALSQFSALALLDDPDCVMFCMGGYASAVESGAFHAVLNELTSYPVNVPRYTGIPAEPDTRTVRDLVKAFQENKPDLVVAIGGGSVMDAAKAAYLSWQTGMDVKELFGVEVASRKFKDVKFKKVVCVPTTAGTGSEVTGYSNIIDADTGVKCLISDSAIIPEYAFVNPHLTRTLPDRIRLSTALDALVHAIESLLNWKAAERCPKAEKWAVTAVEFLLKSLAEARKNCRANESVMRLSAAATLGGMCIAKCPTSLPHLCSFSLCGKTTHGMAVASLLPHFWRYYLEEPEVRKRTLLLAPLFPGKTPEEIVDEIQKFIEDSGCSIHPGDLTGTGPEMIDKLAEDAKRNEMKLQSAPRPVSAENAATVFHQVLDGIWNA